MPKAVDYSTVPREELVKIATELRAERDTLRDERDALVEERDMLVKERDALVEERDKLRRAVRNDMRRFCEDCVPDFTPLGGNRPDCAVATCATVSLSAKAFVNKALGTENPLPPDVLACAAGILCAPVIIDGSLDYKEAVELCARKGPARTLSARLRLNSEKELRKYCGDSDDSDDEYYEGEDDTSDLPWEKGEDYQAVALKVELASDIKAVPQYFLRDSKSVKCIDLSSTQLTALPAYFLQVSDIPSLSEVQLPTTLVTIGGGFLCSTNIKSLDLRHLPNLKTIGIWFMRGCAYLTELHLPPSVETIKESFLRRCNSIESIDLSSTSITTISEEFGSHCGSLTDIKLPPSITAIDHAFLANCVKIKSIDLRHLTGLMSLGGDFMCGCDSLTEVYLPDTLTALPKGFLEGSKLNPVCHRVGVKRSSSDG